MQPLLINIVAYHPIRQVSSKVKKQQDFYNNISKTTKTSADDYHS